MYFLRWIAGYPILIILLVVGLYALYNKDNLTHWFEKNEAAVQTAELGFVGEHVASTVEKASPKAETIVEAEGKPGSWLDIFKGRETEIEAEAEAASLPAQEEQTVATTEEPSSAGVEIAKAEEDRFGEQMMEGIPPMPGMGDIPPMPEFGEMPPLSEMGDIPPMPEFGDFPPMSEMKEFPPMEPFPEMPMEPVFAPSMDESVAVMALAADEYLEKSVPDAEAIVEAEGSDATEGKSGSWLDIFKSNKTEKEEASVPVQEEQPVTVTEAEPAADVDTAKVEKEEKSGSWLDIFKRKNGESSTENLADTSPEFQLQQNESLRLAREAFWQRDFDAAEAIYTNMTKAEPENAGLLGEYGNVLLEAGKMEQALDVYEQVAGLLIAEGRTFELRPLLYFISDQDPERAQKLTQKIQAQQETNK